jgi:glycolate oxidase iron-sulfur subunit
MSTERRPAVEWDSLCVHCGLCLDTCPTYRLTGLEAESPRGRLYLMDAVLEGAAVFDRDLIEHLDSCLGCLACESACPSGVRFGSRIEAFRPRIARENKRLSRRTRGWLASASSNSRALRFIRSLASAFDRLGLESLRRRMGGFGLVPRRGMATAAVIVPSPETPRLRVALLVGCVADQLRPSITSCSVNVLHRNGVEAVLLPVDTCCGALDLHCGNSDAATRSAAGMCQALAGRHFDYVVTTAAGCGAILRRYEEWLGVNRAGAEAATWVARNTRDICELLVEIGLRLPLTKTPDERAIAYHDACHLLHGSGIARAPREVLTAAGVRWFDLGDNAICCGSAGVYNLLHPGTALELAERKLQLLFGKNASDVAVGNIGCIMQLERALARVGRSDVGVWHPVELLEAAYQKEAVE